MNESATLSEICPTPHNEAYQTNNNSIYEQPEEPVADTVESNKTLIVTTENVTTSIEPLNLVENKADNYTVDSINTKTISEQSTIAVTKNKKSMIIITSAKNDLIQIENEIKKKYATDDLNSKDKLSSVNEGPVLQENNDKNSKENGNFLF